MERTEKGTDAKEEEEEVEVIFVFEMECVLRRIGWVRFMQAASFKLGAKWKVCPFRTHNAKTDLQLKVLG